MNFGSTIIDIFSTDSELLNITALKKVDKLIEILVEVKITGAHCVPLPRGQSNFGRHTWDLHQLNFSTDIFRHRMVTFRCSKKFTKILKAQKFFLNGC